MGILPTFILRKIEHRPNLLKVINNISWLVVDKLLRMGVGLFVGVWLARYLGPEQFGLLSLVTAMTGLFGALAGMGIQGILVREIIRDREGRNENIGSAILIQMMGGMIAYALMFLAMLWLRPNDKTAQLITITLGAIMLLKPSEVANSWFESQVQAKYTVWVQNVVFLLFAVVKIVMILNQATLAQLTAAVFMESIMVAVAMVVIFDRIGIPLKNIRFNSRRVQTLIGMSWPLMVSSVAVMVYMKIDQVMIGTLLNDNAVGVYTAAAKISEIWYFIATAIGSSVLPALIEAKKTNQRIFLNRMQNMLDAMVWISILIAIPVCIFATPIVEILYGKAYKEAASVLMVHVWATLFVFIGVASNNWLLIENKQLSILYRSIIGAVFNVLLNFILIPKFGVIGAAWATLVSYALAAMIIDGCQRSTHEIFFMKLKSLHLANSYIRLLEYKKYFSNPLKQ